MGVKRDQERLVPDAMLNDSLNQGWSSINRPNNSSMLRGDLSVGAQGGQNDVKGKFSVVQGSLELNQRLIYCGSKSY